MVKSGVEEGKKKKQGKKEIKNKTELKNQPCGICNKNTLTLMEEEAEVPYFGKVFIFSATCSNCGYHKADVEPAEQHEPARYTLEVSGEGDLNIRLVRSSTGTIKIPHIITMEGGSEAQGYVTNVEGLLDRVKKVLEVVRDEEEDAQARKKIKRMLKKLTRVLWGKEKLKIILEDQSGNSAIISDKAVKKKL